MIEWNTLVAMRRVDDDCMCGQKRENSAVSNAVGGHSEVFESEISMKNLLSVARDHGNHPIDAAIAAPPLVGVPLREAMVAVDESSCICTERTASPPRELAPIARVSAERLARDAHTSMNGAKAGNNTT